jgi:predicted TIM-barrel fold metal-dependent hydrolase
MNNIIDTNVYLGRWPFRRLPDDEPQSLVARLRKAGVSQAWTGSFHGLLHRNVAEVNERLAEDCRTFGDGLLLPFGSINPTLPAWEEDLRRCHEVHHMRGIRLHPNYHGYLLDDPRFARLLAVAAERKLIVQLTLSMEDERMQHPRLQVPHVNAAPLAALVKTLSGLRLVVLNAFRAMRVEQLERLALGEGVYFEIAMLEGVGGVQKLVQQVTAERVLFGSYAPYFIFESATLKMQESDIGGMQSQAILHDNAAKLLAG